MALTFSVDTNVQLPAYKQLINQIENGIRSGELKGGDLLPSMNELAADIDISKETVKKAYTKLRDRGILTASQGKGFFVADRESGKTIRILILFDKLSESKQVLFNAFFSRVKEHAEITLQLHNQDVSLLEYYIGENLGAYDYFVITPHFPLDGETRKKVLKQLRRIPSRMLILLDHNMTDFRSGCGAVHQDFTNDVYDGLKQGLKKLKASPCLNVITAMSSLYYEQIIQGVRRFCGDYGIRMCLKDSITPDIIKAKEVYLILNGQLDLGLVALAKAASEKGLKPGRDFSIISYNESPIDEIVLGGLTTISTDFEQMGQIAADMILTHDFRKVHCDFKMTRRSTF